MTPDYYQYFETVAENHKQIGHKQLDGNGEPEDHFARVDMGELENDLVVKLKTPLLAVVSPTIEASGNHSNPRWDVIGRVLILDHLQDQMDFAKVLELEEKCRQIAEDVAAKMMKDRKLWDEGNTQFVLPGLDETSFNIRFLHYEWRPMVGVMMSFNWNQPRERFDISKWNNEQDYR